MKNALAVITVLVSLLPAAANAVDIGVVQEVEIYAYGTPPDAVRRPLFNQTDISSNEIIETVSDGGIRLRFNDGSEFRAGGGSRIVLNSFVYDPDSGVGELILTMSKGIFRFISGRLIGDSVTLRTPTLTVGMRGTDLYIAVAEDGSTIVQVLEGEVAVRYKTGGAPVIVTEDSSAGFALDGTVTRDVPRPKKPAIVTGEMPSRQPWR